MEPTAQPQFHLFSFISLNQKLTILPSKLLDLPVYHSPVPELQAQVAVPGLLWVFGTWTQALRFAQQALLHIELSLQPFQLLKHKIERQKIKPLKLCSKSTKHSLKNDFVPYTKYQFIKQVLTR